MRIKSPQEVKHIGIADESLIFKGSRGEHLQVSVLEHDVIRVQHLPDGKYRLDRTWTVVGAEGQIPKEGRSRSDIDRFTCPSFEIINAKEQISLNTKSLTIQIAKHDFYLSWLDAEQRLFAEDLPKRAYVYDHSGTCLYHYMRLRENAHFYGFGDKSGPLDKRGMRMEMRNLDTLGYSALSTDPLYKHWPFYITFLPDLNIAYGLFYDNLSTSVFDMGKELDSVWGPFHYYMAQDGDLDYYMLFGPSIEEVVEKFVNLTGKPFLPPLYSLGYLGSTMSYTETPDAQNQLNNFIDLVNKHDIPCDMFQLSSGYTVDGEGNRCVFTWNRSRFPDPVSMSESFHKSGIHLAANIKPYLLEVHPNFSELSQQGGFLKDPETDQPANNMFWSSVAYKSAPGAFIDFTSALGYGWWQRKCKEQLFDFGIDLLWNDNNEFEIWDDDVLCDGFDRPFRVGMGRPLQTLLMGHASYYATMAYRPHERPFVLTRSGCPGIQRYAQTWSGDNATSWETLRYNIPMGLNMGLSGISNMGHDVGGFYGPKPDAELFVRWVQNGIFHPRFSIHSWNTDGTVNEPWMYPEVLPLVREAIDFRYRLIPYMYSLFVEAHRSGHPIVRPLVYHFADDPQIHAESFDFMLGSYLLVASVLEPGAITRKVYLPASCGWYDFYEGEWFEGGQIITLDAPLSRFPLLVPEGGIIPTGKRMRHVGELPDDERVIYVFPHQKEGSSQFVLVEDDGHSNDYLMGVFTDVIIEMATLNNEIHLRVTADQSRYSLPYKQIQFVFPHTETRSIYINQTLVKKDQEDLKATVTIVL